MLQRLQNTILEMLAKGVDLRLTIDTLCRTIEDHFPEMVCSVLTLDGENRLHPLAGPSLPTSYTAAIDGVQIGHGVGSCGTAAHSGKPVVVTDVTTHPYWARYHTLAVQAGLRACWSSPILSSNRVLGTFAIYYREKRGPTALEKRIVTACMYLCAIAIERDQRLVELRRLAQIDPLTRLPNRASFNEAVEARGRSGAPWALLLADLDDLKLINDRLGHQAGDDLIRCVGERIAAFDANCEGFRLGGDEFAVLCCRETGEDLPATAHRLLEALKAGVECGGQLIYPSVTIGGATADPSLSAEQVRQNADYALYHAKDKARGSFLAYVSGLGTAIAKRYRAIQDLGQALRENRIEAHYQPIIHLPTGRVNALEALCRMRLHDGRLVTAGEFHEATRDGQVAFELTERMLETIALDARKWLDAGLEFGRVGLNVCATDFYRGDLCQRVFDTFTGVRVPLSRVAVEVTESVYLERRDRTVSDQIARLREAGITVALDDFGTGFASLTHLLTVPVDVIKIDKCFVQRMAHDHAGTVIIKGLIDIAHGIGIRVVAEGVETEPQANALARLGCERAQGYLFSRPLAPTAVAAFLECRNQSSRVAS